MEAQRIALVAPASKPVGSPNSMTSIAEYLPRRLYLASYLTPPTEETVFPYPDATTPVRSPGKRPKRAIEGSSAAPSAQCGRVPYYFSVDEELLYNAFHHDFGPLHIGHLYRFALLFHEILGAEENDSRPVVFWSRADPRSRANAACLLACYMVLIQGWAPHLALAPIAQVDPPLMPFRDAGYSQADYGISVQDVVYGVWKAKEEGCCVLQMFDLEEYEQFERVEHGDFNWITPHFLAFASPQHKAPITRVEQGSELWQKLPKTLEQMEECSALPKPFKNVLRHFSERNVGLVVRLNSALYSPSYFEALGIQHLDMIFDDGTCPPLSTVRKFIRLANEVIVVRKKGIAVHCKAGLGRTGCLIGAYLIYRHGFTADEVISFMRFMRPGMVVGPQQHWLHLNQGTFREWWVEERVERKLRKEAALAAATAASNAAGNPPSTPIRAMQRASIGRSHGKILTSTPPAANRGQSTRTPLSEVDLEQLRDNKSFGVQEDYLPAPTPGQPRKTLRGSDRHHPYVRVQHSPVEEEPSTHCKTQSGEASEEEMHQRVRSPHRKPSTNTSPERRSASSHYSTTSMTSRTSTSTSTSITTMYQLVDNDASRDIENIGVSSSALNRTKSIESPQRASSASGVLTKVRRSGSAKRERHIQHAGSVRDAGVRKTSGRVGSASHSPAAGASLAAASVARKISGL